MAFLSAAGSRVWHLDHAARVAASIEAQRIDAELAPRERAKWRLRVPGFVSQGRPAL